MISQRKPELEPFNPRFKEQYLGAVGYLAIFRLSLAAVMATPAERLPWAAGVCLLVAACLPACASAA